MLLPEVSAAVSVLLGFAPPATLSAAGSAKVFDNKWCEVILSSYFASRYSNV